MNNSAYKEFLFRRHSSFNISAGKYKWWGLDSKKNFDKNIHKLGFYVDNPIEYSINRQLFRCEFDFDKNAEGMDVDIAVGCSHTFGTGHLLENTWPNIVSKYTGRKVINLGCPGHGVETSYINLKKYIEFFNVKNVFHYQPIYSRYYVYDGVHNSFILTTETSNFNKTSWSEEYIKTWLISDELILHNHYKLVDACKGVCSFNNINYLHLNDIPSNGVFDTSKGIASGYWRVNSEIEGDIVARDLFHYTVAGMKEIANNFIDRL